MLGDKKMLLICSKSTAEYIKSNAGGNFTSFIVDIVRFVNKQKASSEQKVQQLWQILFNVKNTNIEIIGGGKSIKESYVKFVDEFLSIRKMQNKYICENTFFNNLNIEEIYYIFAWVRRLVKEKPVKKSEEKIDYSSKSYAEYEGKREYRNVNKDNHGKRNKQKRYESFNNQFAEQLKNYMEINNNFNNYHMRCVVKC